MHARILGSAAGGGFPQWNCACGNCSAVRRADRRYIARTQDSLAVFARDDAAVLCNVSPDVAQQIEATPTLRARGKRHTPIAAIVLTSGDLDHVLGLFSLREAQPLAIYATAAVRRQLVDRNAICATLARFPGQAVWRDLELDRDIELAGPDGTPTGVVVRAFALAGQLPGHVRDVTPSAEDNIGLRLRCPRSGKTIVYAPSAANASATIGDDADVLVFDGTYWSNDELITLGCGTATARELAHQPIDGVEGSLARFAGSATRRKIYTHVNNTNPVLAAGSAERLAVELAGWELAEDGLEILP
jgi:pyrroloquinoline quinone biosynthesis protein B